MSEVRCPGGHFMGHQKEYAPYSFEINAQVALIGFEGKVCVYKASRPRRPRPGEAGGPIPVTVKEKSPFRDHRVKRHIDPPIIVICGQRGCGKRATIKAR